MQTYSAPAMVKEYYGGNDDGQLVRSEWVEYDGDYYFVNSSGAKDHKRLEIAFLTQYDDDTADEWYYFKSNIRESRTEKIAQGKNILLRYRRKDAPGWVTTGDGATSQRSYRL